MNKKHVATSFLQLGSSGQVREAFAKYVHPDFRHHLAYFKGDRKSYLQALAEASPLPTGFVFMRYRGSA